MIVLCGRELVEVVDIAGQGGVVDRGCVMTE